MKDTNQIVQIMKPKFEPRCSVCRFMKESRNFKERILLSTYFHPEGNESIDDVLRAFGHPMARSQVYRHLQTHQGIQKGVVKDDKTLTVTRRVREVLSGELVENRSDDPHEKLLDELIGEGKQLLEEGRLTMTTNQVLAAIKIKSDILSKNKDRKVSALKTLFAGAAPKEDG